jgi:hypothetical protein
LTSGFLSSDNCCPLPITQRTPKYTSTHNVIQFNYFRCWWKAQYSIVPAFLAVIYGIINLDMPCWWWANDSHICLSACQTCRVTGKDSREPAVHIGHATILVRMSILFFASWNRACKWKSRVTVSYTLHDQESQVAEHILLKLYLQLQISLVWRCSAHGHQALTRRTLNTY